MAANIKLIMSGGVGNTNGNNSLGGSISTQVAGEIPVSDVSLNNLFDNISKIDNVNQVINYRCVYIKNTGDQIFGAASVFLTGTTAAAVRIALATVNGSGVGVKNLTAQTVADEKGNGSGPYTEPLATLSTGGTTAISWETPSESSPLALPDLNPGDYIGIWIEREPNNITGSGTITDIIGLVVRGVQ